MVNFEGLGIKLNGDKLVAKMRINYFAGLPQGMLMLKLAQMAGEFGMTYREDFGVTEDLDILQKWK